MNSNKKEVVFKVGDVVTAQQTCGIPAMIRNFKPLKDRKKELEQYAELNTNPPDKGLGAFSITMVWPPYEGGGRYRIIESEQYEILVEGKYSELFHAPKSKKNESAEAPIATS